MLDMPQTTLDPICHKRRIFPLNSFTTQKKFRSLFEKSLQNSVLPTPFLRGVNVLEYLYSNRFYKKFLLGHGILISWQHCKNTERRRRFLRNKKKGRRKRRKEFMKPMKRLLLLLVAKEAASVKKQKIKCFFSFKCYWPLTIPIS